MGKKNLPTPSFSRDVGASDISSVQAEGVSGHNRKTVVPSWVRRDNSCFLYRGAMGDPVASGLASAAPFVEGKESFYADPRPMALMT